ncbi:MAG: hypothetical protein QOH28_2085 [Actinomycetota bacterium]|nr:hypothetical protein [Actinomycetota bacterium]
MFLPRPLAERVDGIRTRFDPETARHIRPHITVVHDAGEALLGGLRSQLEFVASTRPPLSLRLTTARCWGAPEAGIYLAIEDGQGAIGAIRRALGVIDAPEFEYVPHVTLTHARTVSAPQAREAWDAIRGWTVDETVSIDRLAIVELDGSEWRTRATVAMGRVLEDPATPLRVTDRVAARVLLVDDDGALLLLRGCDPARPEAGTWWFTPGGGLDDGETVEAAARRELREETGFAVADLGPVVFRRTAHFDFEGVRYRQAEHFFCARSRRFAIDDSGWSDVERRSVLEHRWWTHAELVATSETLHPGELAQILDDVLARGPDSGGDRASG